jgi:alpha-beta hydrolase superfamily lysophospholipase
MRLTGSRAEIGALMNELRDVLGNRDRIWGNETKPAGSIGNVFERNPLSLKIGTGLGVGFSKRDEIAAIESFRKDREAEWGAPVMDPAIEGALNGGGFFAAHKAITLARIGRTPRDVTEAFVVAKGKVAGKEIPETRVFTQRFRSIGEPTGDVVVCSPGFLETGRVFIDQVQRLNQAGIDVIVMDHQWAGHTRGKRGGIANGESIALHAAAVLAYAGEIAKAEYGEKGHVALLGESMGAGAGGLGPVLMNAVGKLELRGPQIPSDVDIALQAPFLGASPNLINGALSGAAKIPVVNGIAMPGLGLPDFVDEPKAEHVVAQGMVLEDIRGRLQAFRASDAFIETMRNAIEAGGRPGGKVIIVHDAKDPLADPNGSQWLAEKLGGQADLIRLDGGNHGLASSDPNVAVDRLIAHLRARRQAA